MSAVELGRAATRGALLLSRHLARTFCVEPRASRSYTAQNL